jgi:hypothetical protein
MSRTTNQPEPEQETAAVVHPAPARAALTQAAPAPRGTEITVEFNQVVVIKKPEGLVADWCPACRERVHMITTEAAAVIANVDTRMVYRLIDSGSLHFAETPEGLVLVCLNSLVR